MVRAEAKGVNSKNPKPQFGCSARIQPKYFERLVQRTKKQLGDKAEEARATTGDNTTAAVVSPVWVVQCDAIGMQSLDSKIVARHFYSFKY